jgi:hypothetical protein
MPTSLIQHSMYIYITGINSLNSIESQDNVYDCMSHISTKKSLLWQFLDLLIANKNSLSLCAYICSYKLVLKGLKNLFLIFLELSFIGKSVMDDGVSAMFVTGRGCPAAVVRLWHTNNGPPLELCGEKPSTERWQYLSENNSMQIR